MQSMASTSRIAHPPHLAELVIHQLAAGFYHASAPGSIILDDTLTFTFTTCVYGCALNEYGLDLSRFLDFGCVAPFLPG